MNRCLTLMLAFFLLSGTARDGAKAASEPSMNLELMVRASDRVFLGQVTDATELSVVVAEGPRTAWSYRLRVLQTFKGTLGEYTELHMLSSQECSRKKNRANMKSSPLNQGEIYLLLMAPQGPFGLRATMGQGQGCFHLLTDGPGPRVLNAINNRGLLRGMGVGVADGRALEYETMAALIRGVVASSPPRGRRK